MANVMTVREVLKKKKNPLHAHHFKNRGAKEMHLLLFGISHTISAILP